MDINNHIEIWEPSSIDTIEVYNRIAKDYVERTFSADMTHFYDLLGDKLPVGSKILDVGSGSGRDALALTARGYHVDILEPSSSLRDEFIAKTKDYPGSIYTEPVQEVELPTNHYDGIYACASLLHVTPTDWPAALQRLHKAVKPGGLLYVSVKKCPSGFDSEGRWFTGFASVHSLKEVVELASPWQMEKAELTNDSLGRETLWFEAWFRA